MQVIYLTKDLYPKYTKNFKNSKTSENEMGKILQQSFRQRGGSVANERM